MTKPILYNAYLSPFARKAHIVLKLKKVDYQDEQIQLFGKQPDNWSDISPLRKIPVYEEDGQRIPDSSVICEYLEERYPSPSLLPSTAQQRARCRWFEEYSDTAMAKQLVATIFFQRIVCALLLKQEADEALVQKALQENLPPIMDYLEKSLAGKDWLVGDSLSMADISVCCQLINLVYGGHTLDATRWPGVAALYQRLTALPEVSSVMAIEQKILRSLKGK